MRKGPNELRGQNGGTGPRFNRQRSRAGAALHGGELRGDRPGGPLAVTVLAGPFRVTGLVGTLIKGSLPVASCTVNALAPPNVPLTANDTSSVVPGHTALADRVCVVMVCANVGRLSSNECISRHKRFGIGVWFGRVRQLVTCNFPHLIIETEKLELVNSA